VKLESVQVSCDATLSTGGVVTVTEFDLQAKMSDVPIWLENSTIVFVQGGGKLYRSTNGGMDWNLTVFSSPNNEAVVRLVTTADPTKILIFSMVRQGRIWFSDNSGQSWKSIDTGLPLVYMSPHPRIPGLIAGITRSLGCYTTGGDCYYSVYASSNGLYDQWYKVSDHTGLSLSWGVHPSIATVANSIAPDTLFITDNPNKKFPNYQPIGYDLQMLKFSFVSSPAAMKSEKVLDHCYGFFIADDIIFAAVLPSVRANAIVLYVSRDGATTPLKLAQFPYSTGQITSNAYIFRYQ